MTDINQKSMFRDFDACVDATITKMVDVGYADTAAAYQLAIRIKPTLAVRLPIEQWPAWKLAELWDFLTRLQADPRNATTPEAL